MTDRFDTQALKPDELSSPPRRQPALGSWGAEEQGLLQVALS